MLGVREGVERRTLADDKRMSQGFGLGCEVAANALRVAAQAGLLNLRARQARRCFAGRNAGADERSDSP